MPCFSVSLCLCPRDTTIPLLLLLSPIALAYTHCTLTPDAALTGVLRLSLSLASPALVAEVIITSLSLLTLMLDSLADCFFPVSLIPCFVCQCDSTVPATVAVMWLFNARAVSLSLSLPYPSSSFSC